MKRGTQIIYKSLYKTPVIERIGQILLVIAFTAVYFVILAGILGIDLL